MAREDDGSEEVLSAVLTAVDQARFAVLVADREGRVEFVNDAFVRIAGRSRAEILSAPLSSLQASHTEDDYAVQLARALSTGEVYSGILALRDGAGAAARLETLVTPVLDPGGAVERVVALGRCLTPPCHEGEGAFRHGLLDPLTGLRNRVLFLDHLRHAIARTRRRSEASFAVLFLDLDRFKVVNDGLGHETGDRLLTAIARRLEAGLRGTDTVARLGGDEFGILLEDIQGVQDATAYAARLLSQLKEPFGIDGREVYTTASIGIAESSLGYERAEDVLRDADLAMYRAKALGRVRFVLFDKAMRDEAMDVLDLETDLRRAVERLEFTLHYQPIVSLKSGRVAGFEALLRWPHGERGLIPPAKFIPLAEETGLIIPLGLWIFRQAVQQLNAWHARFPQSPPLFVSVNLSGVQLLQPELTMELDLMLREFGVDGRHVKLEITESAIMEHAQYAQEMLQMMKAQSLRLCIDDFGTGYSSMSYLRRYPFDTVKVDYSFVSKMVADDESLEIVRSIVTMAHNLKMDVVAEGVETHEQLARLRALKCEYGQGFFFSRGLEPRDAEALLASNWYW